MGDLILYIFKKYGLKLSEEEIKEVIEWFNRNSSRLVDEEIIDIEIKKYLYERFNGRSRHEFAEDTSNMKYLLLLLKENKGK